VSNVHSLSPRFLSSPLRKRSHSAARRRTPLLASRAQWELTKQGERGRVRVAQDAVSCTGGTVRGASRHHSVTVTLPEVAPQPPRGQRRYGPRPPAFWRHDVSTSAGPQRRTALLLPGSRPRGRVRYRHLLGPLTPTVRAFRQRRRGEDDFCAPWQRAAPPPQQRSATVPGVGCVGVMVEFDGALQTDASTVDVVPGSTATRALGVCRCGW